MPFCERYGPWAVVLGASEGIGRAWSLALAREGLDVVLVARRKDKLLATAAEVQALGRQAHTLSLDLGERDAGARLAEALAPLDVGLVVYNACFSRIGRFLDLSEDDKVATVDVNARGPLLVAHHLAPRLVARGRGGIVLMSSMSGFQGSAMVGVYAATKAFDTVLGEMLWAELGPRGVDVLVCAAGATLTPNFMAATPGDKQKDALPMPPEDVVAGALRALRKGRGPTFIPGWVNRIAYLIFGKLLPRRSAVRFMSAQTTALYEGDAP